MQFIDLVRGSGGCKCRVCRQERKRRNAKKRERRKEKEKKRAEKLVRRKDSAARAGAKWDYNETSVSEVPPRAVESAGEPLSQPFPFPFVFSTPEPVGPNPEPPRSSTESTDSPNVAYKVGRSPYGQRLWVSDVPSNAAVIHRQSEFVVRRKLNMG